MTETFLRQPVTVLLVCVAMLSLACGGAADRADDRDAAAAADADARSAGDALSADDRPSDDRPSDEGRRATAPRAAEEAPAAVSDPEARAQALSASVFAPGDATDCGLPEVSAGGGALLYFGCTPATGPLLRAVPARSLSASDRESALAALLDGPTDAERAAGYLSSFGTETASIEWRLGVDGSTTWVDFDRSILEVDGLFVVPMDAAQIVATLGQFEGTDEVLLLVGGEPLCRALGDC